jgi:uncharacterized protein (TIGR02001 family)
MNLLTWAVARRCRLLAAAVVSLAVSAPAFAEETAPPSDWTITGSAGLYSQYRFRGISLSDEDVAVQGSLGLSHGSGFYVGAWGSNLAGFGSFGGSNMELDLYAGYAGEAGGVSYDASVVWYTYPGTDETDYFEFIGKLSKELGPVKGTLGLGYVPDQNSVGSEDNFYVFGDLAGGIPNTPVTLKAHLGYSDGDGTLSPTGSYLEWSLGADIAIKNLTLGVAYVDTDLGNSEALTFLDPTRNIADANVVISLSAAF